MDVDLLSPESFADPYGFFGALREQDPVHWNPGYRAWVITRYDDVAQGFLDKRLSSDRVQVIFDEKLTAEQQAARRPTYAVLADWMVFKDPPDHTRVRNLVKRAFTPRAVEALAPRIADVVDEVLDLPAAGELDVVGDVAYPIPALVIADLLGVPREDRHRFRGWSNDISTLVFEGARSDADRARAQDGLVALADYLRALLAELRAHPGDNLLSTLARVEESGDALREEEIVNTCVLLLFGGHETTTNLIGNAFLALLGEPAQAAALREDPSTADAAVEELIRYDGPSKVTVRRAVAPIELRGRTIAAGQRVLLVQASANRDPERFPDADRLDLRREDNRNVAFGFGIHYCLGAPLARLETAIALPRMLDTLTSARLADGELEYQPVLLSRGLKRLRLRYGC